MRYHEIVFESKSNDLDSEVEYLHREYQPQEGDDFLAVADLVSNESQFDVDSLIKAYYAKYGNPYRKSKVSTRD